MTQEEQIRLYRLMEKLNLVFPPGDALSRPGYCGTDRAGVLSGDPGVTYDILWNDLPKRCRINLIRMNLMTLHWPRRWSCNVHNRL